MAPEEVGIYGGGLKPGGACGGGLNVGIPPPCVIPEVPHVLAAPEDELTG